MLDARTSASLAAWRAGSLILLCVILCVAAPSHGAWFDAAWPFRRSLDVKWDVARPTGEDVAWADVFTAGHLADEKDARDLRIATDSGKVVPSRVLFTGPGDVVRVAFAMPTGQTKFYAYFGNKSLLDKPPPQFTARAALLQESRIFRGEQVGTFDRMEKAWREGGPMIGAKYVAGGLLGYNPFGEQGGVISRLSGAVFAPMDGEYTFAVSVDDVGCLYIDGKPLIFARIGPGDARHSGNITLTRGRHDLLFYHLDYGGETRYTIAWRTPGSGKFTAIGRAELGPAFGSVVGPLEQIKKTLVADFSAEHVSECWVDGNFSQRFRFTGRVPGGTSEAKFEWDFGDGQTATGPTVDHVFVRHGVYPIRVTARIGGNADAQTTRFNVTRDYDGFRGNPLAPPTEEPRVFADLVTPYNARTMPLAWLPAAAKLLAAGGEREEARAVAARIATEREHPDRAAVLAVLMNVPADATQRLKLWEAVPADSALQPTAARELAKLLLWSAADFPRAVKVLAPFEGKGEPADGVRLGQALVLAGEVDRGTKILIGLASDEPPARRVAVSGAMARTIEAFVNDKDWESGDVSWDDWMTRYPADFLGGYAVWLKVRLIEVRGDAPTAAKVAEAFASAIPTSSYAPRLFDHAARLIEKSDATKSAELRKRLKEKYPEDPLSQ
jgi:hypothetical protein